MRKFLILLLISLIGFTACNQEEDSTRAFMQSCVTDYSDNISYDVDDILTQVEMKFQENPDKVKYLRQDCYQIKESLQQIDSLYATYTENTDLAEFKPLANKHFQLLQETMDIYGKQVDLNPYQNSILYDQKEVCLCGANVLTAMLKVATYKVLDAITYDLTNRTQWSDPLVNVTLNKDQFKPFETLEAQIRVYSYLIDDPIWAKIDGETYSGQDFVEYSKVLTETGNHTITGYYTLVDNWSDTVSYQFSKQINVTQ